MKRTNWSKEEIELLKHWYVNDGLSYDKIFLKFKEIDKHRSRNSIHVKITRLKLTHSYEQTYNIKSKNVSGEKNPMYGKKGWSNGLTKDNSEQLKKASEKQSMTRKQMFLDGLLRDVSGEKNPMFGKKSWSNGLTKFTDKRLLKIGEITSIRMKKEWDLKTEEEKKVITDRLNKAMIQNRKPTRIENKIDAYLKSLSLNFKQNKRLNGFLVDFYIYDFNVVIECDGDYWHANPIKFKDKVLSDIQLKNIDRDNRKNIMLNENSIKYLRFWEFDIHNNFDNVKKQIQQLLYG